MSLLAIGVGLQVFGQLKSNMDEAAEARRSAQWLREQAAHFRNVTNRQKFLVGQQVQGIKADRSVATAGSGIELTGSFLDMQEQVDYLGSLEIAAIEEQGAMDIREAHLKAAGLEGRAETLSSFGHNAVQGFGTFLASGAATDLFAGAKNPMPGIKRDIIKLGRGAGDLFRGLAPGREKKLFRTHDNFKAHGSLLRNR